MIFVQSAAFKFLDRKEDSSIVLIPGWASDYRIFERIDLKFNYLIPLDFSPFTFEKKLLLALDEYRLDKVSLFGWSLGGFLASEFSSKYPSYIDELILVSIRKKYNKEKINEIKNYLNENKKSYLYKFYSQCFHNNEFWDYFKKAFLKRYYEQMKTDFLINTIDYLAKAEIRTENLTGIKNIKIVHGEFDKIAPLEEAKKIKDKLPQAKFIVIEGVGHIPFWKGDFYKYIR